MVRAKRATIRRAPRTGSRPCRSKYAFHGERSVSLCRSGTEDTPSCRRSGERKVVVRGAVLRDEVREYVAIVGMPDPLVRSGARPPWLPIRLTRGHSAYPLAS